MAGPAVAVPPIQGTGQQSLISVSGAGSDSSSLQLTNSKVSQPATQVSVSVTDSTKPGTPHATPSQSFHRSYQFRPRFPPNKGQEDQTSGLQYDGKRMRKAIHRKTVDYNPSVLNYIRNRIWQRDRRDLHQIQPDSLYAVDLLPPQAMLEHPMNCVTTRFVRTSTNKHRCPIFCVTWTPEGRRLVTGASSGEFTLWNGLTFNFETILQAHETAVRAMRWSHSDAWMVTADHAGYIKYWQSNMNNVKMYQAHKEPVRGISFCPSDTKFASCSDDGTVRVWDFMRCQEERILRGHGADVRCVDWHPQKALLASGSKDNQQPVKLWDPRTGHSIATLHAHKHTVMDLKWNQNGNWILTASRDHLLKLFDVRNLKEEVQTFKGHKREATAIGWHPIHEGLFVSGSADGALMFWMVGCDHEVGGMEEAHEGMVWSVSWHPLGHILASGSNDHATKFWTRNRPGDEMRDKYNLNTLPLGMMEQELLEYNLESSVPNLPGIGLELPEQFQIKDEQLGENELPSIPGLDWEEDAALLKTDERSAQKKVPYARPVPRVFEQAWAGEIDVDQLKKEQQQQQQQQQKPQFIPPSQPSLLLAQQVLGAAIAGTIRQQLAANEAARLILPRGQFMLGPGGPRMIIAPGQPVMGPRAGQMVLFPGGSGAQSLGPTLLQQQQQQQQNNQNMLSQQQSLVISNAVSALMGSRVNAARPHNGTMGPPQQSGQQIQTANTQNQPLRMASNPGQIQSQGQGQIRPLMNSQGQIRPQGQTTDTQGQMNTTRLHTASPNLQSQGQQSVNPRQPGPGPQFQGQSGQQGQLGSVGTQGNRGSQDQDRDERFQGQSRNQIGGPTHTEMDQDYRPRVYNGPAGPANLEDQDFRQQGPATGQNVGHRRANTDEIRNRSSRDFQGSGGDLRAQGDDKQGSHTSKRGYKEEEEEYGEYGDVDERVMDTGDVDHRVISGRGSGRREGGGFNARGEEAGWKDYGRRRENSDKNWESGGYEGGRYDEKREEDYEEQEERGDRGKKRVWGDGPGGRRGGRGAWAQGDGRGQSRDQFRGSRGRTGGYKGDGWKRGGSGDRGSWSRGGHRRGY